MRGRRPSFTFLTYGDLIVTLKECEEYAIKNGFDSIKFRTEFPNGDFLCQWLDAYMGLFKVDGLNGFLMTKDFKDTKVELVECK